MIKIGKYRIYFTSRYWLQTYGQTRVQKILFMTIYWEACSSDVDKVRERIREKGIKKEELE